MKTIKEHIKRNCYSPVYLIYGTEEYLKRLYRDKLKKGMLEDNDPMNYSYLEGKGIDENQVMELADTLPFFSEKRLIVIENSGWFKKTCALSDYMIRMPESTHFIFVEKEVDKRNRLYKKVKEIGTISEMNGMSEADLKLWIASMLKRDQKKITVQTVEYLLSKTGTDMQNLVCELEKLISYTMERDVITPEDIDAICTTQITSKIFQMVDAIGVKNQDMALTLYYDLLTLHEKPTTILYLICRHFNILLQAKSLQQLGYQNQIISQRVGIPPFTVSKYLSQGRNFSQKVLKEALAYGTELEEALKTGNLADTIAIELFIIKYSGNLVKENS